MKEGTNAAVTKVNPTSIRLPADLQKALQEIATAQDRSFNREVIRRLRQSIEIENISGARYAEIASLGHQPVDRRGGA